MNRKLMILAFFVAVVLVVVSVIGVWLWQNKKYQAEEIKVDSQISVQSVNNAKLKSTKDANGYSPEDLVKNFLNEVNNDSPDKEKLYLSKTQQNLDVNTVLGFSDSFNQVIVQGMSLVIKNGLATVNVKGYFPNGNNSFAKIFTLVKENNLWKINSIMSV